MTTSEAPGLLVTAYGIAGRYLSLEELPGGLDHPQIQAWLMACGFGPDAHDEIAWCGAFVRHPAWELQLEIPKYPARARSWLTVGEPVEPQDAQVGFDIVILKRGGESEPGADVLDAPGHVGWFGGFAAWNVVRVRGGNQSNRVSDATFGMDRALGFRRLRRLS